MNGSVQQPITLKPALKGHGAYHKTFPGSECYLSANRYLDFPSQWYLTLQVEQNEEQKDSPARLCGHDRQLFMGLAGGEGGTAIVARSA